MEDYAGIDVSLKESSVCIVDATGKLICEAKVASEPEALIRYLNVLGPLSQWLHAALVAAGREAVLLETRHVKAALSAMTVKTDQKDARGIAQLLRMGRYRPVHAKSSAAQDTRALLVGRKLLQGKLLDVELSIRGILRGYGLKVGEVSRGRFRGSHPGSDRGTRDALDGDRRHACGASNALERVHEAHREMLRIARADGICRRLMSTPGTGCAGLADIPLGGGRPGTVRKIQHRRRLLRADTEKVSVGHKSPDSPSSATNRDGISGSRHS